MHSVSVTELTIQLRNTTITNALCHGTLSDKLTLQQAQTLTDYPLLTIQPALPTAEVGLILNPWPLDPHFKVPCKEGA